MANASCFRIIARGLDYPIRSLKTTISDGMAEKRYHWHLLRCWPQPIKLISGRYVMPNRFDIRKLKVVRPSKLDLEDLGILLHADIGGLQSVTVWWAFVFASMATPRKPLCMICEKEIPRTQTGRACKRDRCRVCVNAAYYLKCKRRDPKKLRESWVRSKRRIRSGQKGS